MSTSTKPYMVRAIYEWCNDNSYTPHIVVWVDEKTSVPLEFVKNNEIVLNISASACKGLRIDNDWISFTARFGGVARELWIPVGNVMSIFARESGEGMGFEVEPAGELHAVPDEAHSGLPDAAAEGPDDEPPRPSGRPNLRIVK
ncbi:ClpXP protease specificity-enhancing factor [Craterilacuibacter sp. RT1T]|uniref:ClpXP protease specificity-enhancing factor n=1 Tax=Craterilacuibacter sp. RT1T TaxID=2942211 RepID=UPI0020BFC90F|nr:ClpXP protease specificity-enhancing factor [Craterilacuibacter sp. RT1T]MCL6263643.1 ClpXP protease specificity-enhancing factor [Craterilacuibacter sp. RT1T]